jgi:polysaccharide export outer membrane protein
MGVFQMTMPHPIQRGAALALILFSWSLAAVRAQQPPSRALPAPAQATATAAPGATLPPNYVIGVSDVLSIVFWRDQDMSADVTVRPDGKISLPLLKEVPAAGYTPEQLREKLVEAASDYVEEPNLTVVVKEIRSRNVFITGNVTKPNAYTLTADMTVMQLIALAGGLQDFADAKHIVVMRTEDGRQHYYEFNYKDVIHQKNPEQNILLKPGDTVVVP